MIITASHELLIIKVFDDEAREHTHTHTHTQTIFLSFHPSSEAVAQVTHTLEVGSLKEQFAGV